MPAGCADPVAEVIETLTETVKVLLATDIEHDALLRANGWTKEGIRVVAEELAQI